MSSSHVSLLLRNIEKSTGWGALINFTSTHILQDVKFNKSTMWAIEHYWNNFRVVQVQHFYFTIVGGSADSLALKWCPCNVYVWALQKWNVHFSTWKHKRSVDCANEIRFHVWLKLTELVLELPVHVVQWVSDVHIRTQVFQQCCDVHRGVFIAPAWCWGRQARHRDEDISDGRHKGFVVVDGRVRRHGILR